MHPHCGPNGFSPPAPAYMCRETLPPHQVPEPGIFALLLVAMVAAWVTRRRRWTS